MMKLIENQKVIIAIDGPSAGGKGTIARKLAERLGLAHLDTGLLYRATGMAVVRAGGELSNAALAEQSALCLAAALTGQPCPVLRSPFSGIDFTSLMQDDALRSDAAGVAASKVSAIPAVRAALLQVQKDFCAVPPDGKPGAVLDGRDIGTVIAPDAVVKIFVTASAEARAERRLKELQGRGLPADYATVLADMKARDARDAERAIAPTKPAPDAVVLDTTYMDAAQALAEAVRIAEAAQFKGKE